jgi:hypothetical protein
VKTNNYKEGRRLWQGLEGLTNFWRWWCRLYRRGLDLEDELYSDEVPEILPPKVDFVFKLLFGDERNKDILADFLSAIFGFDDGEISGDSIHIVDPHQKRIYANDKR